jgi:ATP-dependent Lon protease
LLETIDPLERLKKVYVHLTNEVQRLQVKSEVASEVTRRWARTRRNIIMREQ